MSWLFLCRPTRRTRLASCSSNIAIMRPTSYLAHLFMPRYVLYSSLRGSRKEGRKEGGQTNVECVLHAMRKGKRGVSLSFFLSPCSTAPSRRGHDFAVKFSLSSPSPLSFVLSLSFSLLLGRPILLFLANFVMPNPNFSPKKKRVAFAALSVSQSVRRREEEDTLWRLKGKKRKGGGGGVARIMAARTKVM